MLYGYNVETNFISIQKKLYKGHYKTAYSLIQKEFKQNPLNPSNILLLKDFSELSDVAGYKDTRKTLLHLKKNLQQKADSSMKNELLLHVNLSLEALYYTFNYDKLKKLSINKSSLNKWSLIGPYHKYGQGDIETVFKPEIISLNAIKRGIKRIQVNDNRGYVNLRKFYQGKAGYVYCVTNISAKKSFQLLFFSKGDYTVFVNGKKILTNYQQQFSNQRRILLTPDKDKITIMIKHSLYRSAQFRVLMLNNKGSLIVPMSTLKGNYFKELSVKEIHSPIINWAQKQKKDNYFLGLILKNNNNINAVKYLKKEIFVSNVQHVRLDLASLYFLSYNRLNRRDYYSRAWMIIDKMYRDSKKGAAPQHYMFFKKRSKGNDIEAIKIAKKLLARSPQYIYIYRDLCLIYMRLGYKKEYADLLNQFKKNFPFSHLPELNYLTYLRKYNLQEYISLSSTVIKRIHSKSNLLFLANLLIERGEPLKAYNLKYYFLKYNMIDHYIDLLYATGRYKKAKQVLFQKVLRNEAPKDYIRLGKIDVMNNLDPGLYWYRLLSVNPENVFIEEYNDFINTKKFQFPYEKYLHGDSKFFKKYKGVPSKTPVTVLLRNRVYDIRSKKYGRMLCEDIIKINSDKGASQLGEYKLIGKGNVELIKINVLKGAIAKTIHKLHNVDGDTYISLSGLTKNSIVQIVYVVNSFLLKAGNSSIVSHPYFYLQSYDEPVKELSISVIVPNNLYLNIYTNREWKFKKRISGNKIEYNLRVEDLPSVTKELYSGPSTQYLPIMSFSAFKTNGEYINWLKKFYKESGRIDKIFYSTLLKKLKGKTFEITLNNIYSYIQNNFTYLQNVNYYPRNVNELLYKRKGTPEQLTILMKSMLEYYGYVSYLTVAKDFNRINFKDYISTDKYNNILLYIPVSYKKQLWVDFGNKYMELGNVRTLLEGENALVLLNNGSTKKKIFSVNPHEKKILIKVNFKKNGNALIYFKASFSGYYRSMKTYFNDKKRNVEQIASYMNTMMPLFILQKFNIEDEDLKPFVMSLKGRGLHMAATSEKKFVFSPILNKSFLKGYIRYYKRKTSLHIRRNINETEKYIYTLPSQYKSAVINQIFTQKIENGYFNIVITKEKGSRNLVVQKKIFVKHCVIKPDEYKKFLKFYLKLRNAENFTVVLKN